MKSFLAGKKELSLPALSRPKPPVALRPAGSSRPTGGESEFAPGVEAIKEGEKIIRLVVTCACGERMEIECIYPAGG